MGTIARYDGYLAVRHAAFVEISVGCDSGEQPRYSFRFIHGRHSRVIERWGGGRVARTTRKALMQQDGSESANRPS